MRQMTEQALAGVHVALTTPFTPAGTLDLDGFAALCEDVAGAGMDGLVVGGVCGERAALDPDERRELATAAVAATAGGPLVIVDVSSTDWRRSGALAAHARAVGAHAVLLSPPTEHRPSRLELRDHVRSVAAHDLPVILVDDPATTPITLEPALVCELAALDGVVAFADLDGASQLLDRLRLAAPELPLLIGSDVHALAGRRAGAVGWITAFGGPLPTAARRLWDLSTADASAADALAMQLEPLLRWAQTPQGPTAVKLISDLLGRPGGGPPRPPRRTLEAPARDEVLAALAPIRALLAAEGQP